MFGAIFGDIIGSYYENHCTKEYNFALQRESTFTDDSVLNAATARAILLNGDDIGKREIKKRSAEYAVQYKQFYSYFPYAGFGAMFAEWAADPRNMKRQRSYGNGGAMRVVPIGYAYETIEQVRRQARASCICTHNCHESINGAEAVASAVFLAFHGATKEAIKKYICENFRYNIGFTIAEMRPQYNFNSMTSYSVPPAIISFLESVDYESAVRNAVSLGGDADTMACISGGIAEAYYKKIPPHIKNFCFSRLDYTIKSTSLEFCRRYGAYFL